MDDRGGSGGGTPSGPAGGDLAGSYPNPTVRNGAINSLKVADSTLTGDDIRDSMLTGDDIGNNTLTGDDIDEVTLGRVPSALLGGLGRSGATTVCDPADATFVPCAATEIINVPPGARALVFGRLEANYTSAAGFGWGECRLSASSIGVVPNTQQSLTVGSGDQGEHATLVGVTPPLSAGPTAFGIACNQRQGNITFSEISASVVLISGA